MDLNDHLAKIVEGLVGDITANVLVRVDSAISAAVNNRLANYDYSSHISKAASATFEKKVSEYTIDPKKLETRIVEKIAVVIDSAKENTATLIDEAIRNQIANTDFQRAVTNAVTRVVADNMRDYVFPDNSIPVESLNLANLRITGDQISGGIITEFSSTGIDDRATNVALTILDHATVVENNLLTKDLTVEGSMTINGEFVVNGTVPVESAFYKKIIADSTSTVLGRIDGSIFNDYSTLIFDRIKKDGIDLNRITIDGKDAIVTGGLGPSITSSNLQKLGMLKELQVSGESLLAGTLYVTPKRVGINTIEPGSALSIWDEEVEIVALKKQKDVGSFGTIRQQQMILSANGKDNIVLNIDGSARIDDLRVGTMRFTSSNMPPNYVGERGHVVWNNNPNPGGPMGWICLGASNWANFGIID
jgi:hypothetical protein